MFFFVFFFVVDRATRDLNGLSHCFPTLRSSELIFPRDSKAAHSLAIPHSRVPTRLLLPIPSEHKEEVIELVVGSRMAGPLRVGQAPPATARSTSPSPSP